MRCGCTNKDAGAAQKEGGALRGEERRGEDACDCTTQVRFHHRTACLRFSPFQTAESIWCSDPAETAAPSPSTVLLAGALLPRRVIGLARRATEVGLLVHGVSVAVKLFLFSFILLLNSSFHSLLWGRGGGSTLALVLSSCGCGQGGWLDVGAAVLSWVGENGCLPYCVSLCVLAVHWGRTGGRRSVMAMSLSLPFCNGDVSSVTSASPCSSPLPRLVPCGGARRTS